MPSVDQGLLEAMPGKQIKLPYDEWMTAFMTTAEVQAEGKAYDGLFDGVPTDKKESDMYEPLVAAVNGAGILGDFVLVNTTGIRTGKTSRHCGMYPKTCSLAVTEKRTVWVAIEAFIVCKPDDCVSDPYDVGMYDRAPYTDEGRETLSQIATYASEAFEIQHLTHHFGVVILGSSARLGRWDRAGIVFSSKFDYKKEPAKLAQFFWCMAHMTPEARGHDPSATRILPGSADYDILQPWKEGKVPLDENDYVGKRFAKTIAAPYAWYRLTVIDRQRGEKDFLIGQPIICHWGVVGRATRAYIALSVSEPGMPLVFLKDCWRIVEDCYEREGDILSYLNEKGVKNVPTVVCHGDVEGHRTVSQTLVERAEDAVEPYLDCRMQTHQHYRYVVREVGMPLEEFPTGEVLVSAITDAIIAHEQAYTIAKVLHRDVSHGNILIVPNSDRGIKRGYQGLLTDWELSTRLERYYAERPRTFQAGTWPFMSVRCLSLDGIGSHVQVADELESFLLVIIYCAVLHLRNTCRNADEFIEEFFGHGLPLYHVGQYTCSRYKSDTLTSGELIAMNCTPLVFLTGPPAATSGPRPRATSSTSASAPLPSTATKAEEKHPINDVIATLLLWFSARYEVLKPEPKPRQLPDAFEAYLKRYSTPAAPAATGLWQRLSSALAGLMPDLEELARARELAAQLKRREEFKRVAQNVESHASVIKLLTESLTRSWPSQDRKHSDQGGSSSKSPAIESTGGQAGSAPRPRSQEKAGEKRAASDDCPEAQENTASKRRRVAESSA
ncbi:hypothetical protein PYCCODRAFT_1479349 [Trametes coccinea BRFM310]|uniref:Fungal-type protein kinase domain-containing protein n=1 Tax=Trametes coccinea (strain BRFM310) TaxID=1353009 RepID=A0A1Y2II22_TRAC3|nr:hypothetical protein PYCCODRAFT_1479349 [Trametes coccinea BRFM310]